MNEIIACPACQNKVQLPAEFMGRAVQCPECQHTFVAGGGAAPTAVTAGANDPVPASTQPRQPPSRDSGEPDAWDRAPAPRRPRYAVDDEPDEPYDDWGHRRAALRPDRGGMILAFGILSITVVPLGLIFGPLAWFMGSADVAAIDSGEMNPANRGLVQAGRILGGVGFMLSLLWLLSCGGYFIFVFAMIQHG